MGDKSEPPSIGNSKTDLCPEQITFTEGGPWQRRTKLEKCLLVLVVLLFIAAVIFLILFVVYFTSKDNDDTVNNEECTTLDCLETSAYVAQSIDQRVDPCEDFYQFACGKWMERNPLTPSFPSMNNFILVHEDVQKAMRDLLGEQDPNAIEAIQKTRTFFRSCENTDAMDAKGTKPLLDLLSSGGSNLFPTLEPNWVDENLSLNQILARVGAVGGLGMSPTISMYVSTDLKESRKNIIYFSQPGLGLSSREYFLGDRNSSALLLYQQLYVDLMTHLGANADTASRDAVQMVDFEILVANATLPRELTRDAETRYHKMTVQNLTQRYPQFDWLDYLQSHFSPEGINVTMEEEVVVMALDYYDKIFHAIDSSSRRAVLNYCLWAFVSPFSSLLDKQARDLKSKFSRALTGASRGKERWEECVATTDSFFPDVSGRLYVEKHFSPQAKTKVEDMISDLKDAFKEMIQETDWMTQQTKGVALEKVDAVVNQIGYPAADMNDTYLNEKNEKLNMTENEFFENNMDLRRVNRQKGLLRLRQPVNREEWVYSAAIVNAFYSPLTNAIFFPAGILHRPFFNDQFMDALNYGGIGFAIGHELTHGFDDSGRSFDKEGNLRMWWQTEDLEEFQKRTECMVNQYSSYVEPVVNKTVNGKLTLGEDIADNGGLKEAYRAYRKLIAKRGGKEEPKLPVLEYSPDQLFFINAAQVWCYNLTPELRALYLNVDYHSPNRFRVIGPMQNNEDFSRAFNCPVGSYMNPEKKCHVW